MNNSSVQRSFDMTIHLNKEDQYQFSSIDKQEYDVIIKYLGLKKIKVKSETGSAKLVEVEQTSTVSLNFFTYRM